MQDVSGDNHNEGPTHEVLTEFSARVPADVSIETPKSSKKRKVRYDTYIDAFQIFFPCCVLSDCLFRFEHSHA